MLLIVHTRFVRLRNMVDESWHDIGTELQRRYDLIPNLVNTVKGYAAHEREVFNSVTSLRIDAMRLCRVRPGRAGWWSRRSAAVSRSSWRSPRAIPI